MKLVTKSLSNTELLQMAKVSFGNMVKAVVDIDQGILIVDASLHADLEARLLSRGSKQENLWGINLYPELTGDEFVEFDSMINLRPGQNNRTRGVDDPEVQQKIRSIVTALIK